MELAFTMALAALLMTAAGYAHYRIPLHTAGAGRIAFTRAALILVGIAFGYVGAAGAAGALAPLLFLIGFGLVHAPAAMFVKRGRGAGKS